MPRKADPTTKRVWALPPLPERRPDSHKGDYGRVLVVAGSLGMAGAAYLASKGALRAGAGLVTCACAETIRPALTAKFTCVMTASLPVPPSVLESADVLCVGPGMGRSEETSRLVRSLLIGTSRPVVVDADALAAAPLDGLRGRAVLTPHPGEMAALIGSTPAKVQADRKGVAKAFAEAHGVVLVLKGHGTVVTDGLRVAVNETGNPGMATAGTGDVLSGVIAGLMAQGMAPFEAARLGVHLHGMAGDLAAKVKGMHSMTAVDLLECLSEAFLRCR